MTRAYDGLDFWRGLVNAALPSVLLWVLIVRGWLWLIG